MTARREIYDFYWGPQGPRMPKHPNMSGESLTEAHTLSNIRKTAILYITTWL